MAAADEADDDVIALASTLPRRTPPVPLPAPPPPARGVTRGVLSGRPPTDGDDAAFSCPSSVFGSSLLDARLRPGAGVVKFTDAAMDEDADTVGTDDTTDDDDDTDEVDEEELRGPRGCDSIKSFSNCSIRRSLRFDEAAVFFFPERAFEADEGWAAYDVGDAFLMTLLVTSPELVPASTTTADDEDRAASADTSSVGFPSSSANTAESSSSFS